MKCWMITFTLYNECTPRMVVAEATSVVDWILYQRDGRVCVIRSEEISKAHYDALKDTYKNKVIV